MLEMTLFLANN